MGSGASKPNEELIALEEKKKKLDEAEAEKKRQLAELQKQINDAKAEAAKHEEDARVLQAKKSDLESNAVAVREAKTGEAETLEQERQRLAEELAAKIGDLDANADNVRRRAEELCQETDDLAQREQALEAEHAVFAETKPTLEKTLTKKERDTAGADRVRRRFLEAFNSVGGEEQ